jgi:electron transfer flavoprotein alpha subunit
VPLFEVDAVTLDEDEVVVGVGRGIELKDMVEAPGMGTRTVPVGP